MVKSIFLSLAIATTIPFILFQGNTAHAGATSSGRTAYSTRKIVEAYKSTVDNNYNQAFWGAITVHLKNLSALPQTVEIEIINEQLFNYLWLEFPPSGMSGWTIDNALWFSKTTSLSRSPSTFTVNLGANADQDQFIGAHCVWNKNGPDCKATGPVNGTCISNIPFTGIVDQRGNWSFLLRVRVKEDRGAILASYTTAAGLCGNRGVVQNGATYELFGGNAF